RTLLKKRDTGFEFIVVSRGEAGADEWLEHARGEIVFLAAEPPSALDPDSLAQRCGDEDIVIGDGDSADEAHPFVRRVRHFPPHWRNFQRLRLGSGEALATLRLPAEFAGEPADLPLHPALLDMVTGFMSMVDGFESGVPFCYRRVCLWRPLASGVHSHVRRVENRQPDERSYDATILDDVGNVLMDVAGFTLKAFAEAADTPALPEEQRNFCVEIERSGSLATLGLRPDRRRSPAPGEVEIEVAAAGLNFIEVLYALGLLPEPPGGGVRFGLECAGALTAVGEGVAGLRPGDEVYGLAPRAFSRYTTTAANAIAQRPEDLTLGEAATLPAAFTTAYYSLIIRGRLRRGERVLIHAASGGVGLAAVNIAEWRGAEIFATAGTPAKREYLHSLGIRHVFDSRSLDFAGQVLAATEGRGVDAVLNSLGGEFIPASLSVLARYGRFLELGKRDIFRNTALGLAPFEKHLAFFAIDVGTDLPEFEFVWRQVVRAVQRQIFRSLPYREFSVSRVAEAFEYMAQGKHIGKVVVAIGGADGVSVSARRRRGRPLADIVGRGRTEQRSGHQTTAEAKSLEAARGAAWRDPGHARPALSTAYRDPAGETEAR
ncbi:MAG: zinc-binding dehydrogenase, partial [Gammaproteobacteria bacterium]